VEDTVFYSYSRLISLNEVGGDPGRFGISPLQYHDYCTEMQTSRPRTMLSSSTHDTKRSEDVRARISVLSEIPALWRAAAERWATMNAKHKKSEWPDRNTEYFLYQTMIGAWPIELDRLLPYMEKACREAKRFTNWLTPNEQFEAATRDFIKALYDDSRFLRDFQTFLDPLIEPGRISSLSQLLLKLTSPGIPDTYQGSELWDLSLVDPDNRRPVDYELRRRLVLEIPSLKACEVLKRMDEGLPKMWTLHHALRVRAAHPVAFSDEGTYRPLSALGAKACHVVAYTRGDNVAVIVPRLVLKLAADWQDTWLDLPDGNWRNELSDAIFRAGTLRAADVFASFPVALLVRQ
jgi:(1->4)-alpha-D-glucan 1-alpha-D-glucosylmutase